MAKTTLRQQVAHTHKIEFVAELEERLEIACNNHEMYRTGCINVFCSTPNRLPEPEAVLEPIKLYGINPFGLEFFDFRDGIAPVKAIREYYYNSRLIGVRYNDGLLFSDITHKRENIKLAHGIIKYILRLDKIKIQKNANYTKISFGSDPEFELLNAQRQIISASSNGISSTSPTAQIGADGAGSQVEFRPPAASTPDGAIKAFKKIGREFAQKYPNFSLSLKGDTHPLGGHLHFGCSDRGAIPTIVAAMSAAFGDWSQLNGRARGSYAMNGQYEVKSYGFEYRSLPAAVFGCAKLLKHLYVMGAKIIKHYNKTTKISLKPIENELNLEADKIKLEQLKAALLIKLNANEWSFHKIYRHKMPIASNLSVTISDDLFAATMREQLNNTIKSLRKLRKKINFVSFFGMARSRGDEVVISRDNATLSIGIPRLWRVNESGGTFEYLNEIQIRQVVEKIKSMVWGA